MEYPHKGKPKVSIIACVVEMKGINSIFRTLDSFLPQEGNIDFEFLVVDETPCYREEIYRERFPWVKLIPVERLTPEPYLRNIALKHVQGEIIVFSEDHVIFTRSYLKNLVHAFSKGYKIVGGSVANANPEFFTGWIQYFLEYNKWISRLQDGVVDDLPGCNYAYHITAIKKLEPFTEDDVRLDSFLNKKAKESGMKLYYSHAVKIAHIHETNIITITAERFKFGWIFAARRGFPLWKRIVYVILSPVIAVVEYCRIFHNARYHRTYLWKFFQCAPLLLPILFIWMMGECVGYTVGYRNKGRSGLAMDYYKKLKLLSLPKYRRELLSLCLMRLLRTLSETIRKKLFSGKTQYCPICKSFIRGFLDFGYIQKAWCPVCVSMSWHRLSWLFLQQKTDLFNESPKRMLHIAPEMGLVQRFKEIANLDYLTADLQSPHCMVKMDITDIQYPEHSFDVIYCSHVLEHLTDDRKAMREFERVLKPNGWAILMVPVNADTTIEDPSETNPAERERRFGRHDHVRRYGLDFVKRLEEEGFRVEVALTTQLASGDDIYRMGLPERGAVFFCKKPNRVESFLHGSNGAGE